LSASDKKEINILAGSTGKPRKSSGNDFLDNRKESKEFFDLNGRKMSSEEFAFEPDSVRKMSLPELGISQDQMI
jgi:hypothetical protein